MLSLHEIAEREMKVFINDVRKEQVGLDALKSARTMVVDGSPVAPHFRSSPVCRCRSHRGGQQ